MDLFQRASTGDNTQHTVRCIGIKHNPGLLQNPRLYLFVVNAQQLQRAQKWLGLFEQISPKDKWKPDRLNALWRAHES